jgi:hypothetical protein
MPGQPEILAPDWPAPAGVRAFVTTRELGDAKSEGARAKLGLLLPSVPVWLKQVHGTLAVDAAAVAPGTQPEADASFTVETSVVCAVMAADCMPVLLAARDGSAVGAAHAGWRGLCAGVIERTVEAMHIPGERLIAYLGPAIGPQAYEVGGEVRDAFLSSDPASASAFSPARPGHWLLDLHAVARQRLAAIGIGSVYGGAHCTFSEPARFFSFRRDRAMQRMAACIWRV